VLTLTLVRHGQTAFNAEGRLQGWCDSPLTPSGLAGVRTTAAHLADHDFTAAYTSPAGRARATAAEILAGRRSPRAVELAGLREFGFGTFEARPEAELLARHDPDAIYPAVVGGTFAGLPEGETGPAFLTRVRAAFDRIERRHRAGHVLVVSHGLTLRAYLSLVDPAPMEPLPNASVSVVEVSPHGPRRVLARGIDPAVLGSPAPAAAPEPALTG
jgi:probable phosphoglycerate mutase